MSKTMTNIIFEDVTKINRNSLSNINRVLKESDEVIEDVVEVEDDYPYDNTTEKFCPRCGKTYTDFPAWSRYDNKTMICPDCGVEEAMINYTGGKLGNPHLFDKDTGIMLSDTERKEKFGEEVTIENPSNETSSANKKEIEDKIGELRVALDDASISEDEKKAVEEEIKELEQKLNESSKVLTEAPEDEEFELVDEEPTEELPVEEAPIEEPTEEMTDAEYEDEVEEDKEDTIEDAVEEPFYATVPEYDELRDLLVDLDYRLFLINDNMVCIGRLNGPDIEFLTSNRPENTETEVSEQNEKAEEIEEKAEEDGEPAFEYKWVKAPDTFDKFLNQINVVYLSPEMSDEDKEQYAGIEASHDSVMEFLMNELPEDKKEEHENEEVEETLEDIPTDIPMEGPIDEEPVEEELPEEENEDEEEEEE